SNRSVTTTCSTVRRAGGVSPLRDRLRGLTPPARRVCPLALRNDEQDDPPDMSQFCTEHGGLGWVVSVRRRRGALPPDGTHPVVSGKSAALVPPLGHSGANADGPPARSFPGPRPFPPRAPPLPGPGRGPLGRAR